MTGNKIILRQNDGIIDLLEKVIFEGLPLVECPLRHVFRPKLYIREIEMGAGSLITSRVHNSLHPFVVSKGVVAVSVDGSDWELIKAPYANMTFAGTRRVLYIFEDCIWCTFHDLDFITGEENDWSEPDKLRLVERIEALILEPYENKLLGGAVKYNRIENQKELKDV